MLRLHTDQMQFSNILPEILRHQITKTLFLISYIMNVCLRMQKLETSRVGFNLFCPVNQDLKITFII